MDAKVKAFLDLIAWSEGTSTHPLTKCGGYDVVVSGINGPSVFADFLDHPFAHSGAVTVRVGPPLLISTAAGRYQLLARYWLMYQKLLKLQDFAPASQDAVAVQQIRERHALPMIKGGDIAGAIKACSNISASLPGNDYGQGGHTVEALLNKYQEFQRKV